MKYIKKTTEYLIYLFAFVLPWQTRWIIQTGGTEFQTYSLYGTDVLLLVIIFLAAVRQLRTCLFGRRVTNLSQTAFLAGEFRIDKIWYLIAGFDLFVFVSIFLAADKFLALYKYGWFLLGAGLFWVLGQAVYERRKLAGAFLAGLSLQALLGIYQFLAQSSFASKWLGLAGHDPAVLGVSVVETGMSRWLRAYGGADHPNILGGMMGIGLLLIINYELRITNRRKILNIFILSTLYFLLLTCLFFTFSRAAWLAVVIGFLVNFGFGVFGRNWERVKRLSVYILAGTGLVLILTFLYRDLVFTRISGEGRLEAKSTDERLASYGEAWEIIKERPFFGVGMGNYTLALRELRPERPDFYYQPVHNTFLLVWAETGVFGLLFFVLIIVYPIYKIIKLNPSTSSTRLSSSQAGREIKNYYDNQGNKAEPAEIDLKSSLIVAIMIMMLFDHWWWSLHIGIMIFWFLFSLLNYSYERDIKF